MTNTANELDLETAAGHSRPKARIVDILANYIYRPNRRSRRNVWSVSA